MLFVSKKIKKYMEFILCFIDIHLYQQEILNVFIRTRK